MRVVWAPRALARVAEAVEYIAADYPSAAVTWIDGLFERVALLREQPLQGRQLPEGRRSDLREVLYGRHRVVYRVYSADELHVLTVKHQRQRLTMEDLEREGLV